MKIMIVMMTVMMMMMVMMMTMIMMMEMMMMEMMMMMMMMMMVVGGVGGGSSSSSSSGDKLGVMLRVILVTIGMKITEITLRMMPGLRTNRRRKTCANGIDEAAAVMAQ